MRQRSSGNNKTCPIVPQLVFGLNEFASLFIMKLTSNIYHGICSIFWLQITMPRFPKRKTNKGLFTDSDMREAVTLVIQGRSVRSVAAEKNLSVATLARYVKKQKNSPKEEIRMTPNYSVNKIFSNEEEDSLSEYILICSKMYYGLSTVEVRKLAYEMAANNNKIFPNKWKELQKAGVEWMAGFMHRHPNLSLRLAEGCSLSRATSFNEYNVSIFFTNLENILKKHPNLADGTRIFNLDETATKTVPGESRVIAERGSKQVCRVTSGEKGILVTTCAFVSASGNTIPPAMVFPRVHFKEHMLLGAPPGTLGLAQPTGWMTASLFVEVMKHFIHHTNTTPDTPSLLIFDNHESHLSLEVIKLAKSSGVEIVTLPPHSSNKLQPLDVGVFGPFQSYYRAAHDSWMTRHPGKTFSIYNVAECVGIAHAKAMTPCNIQAAFKKVGIYPYDREVFSEADFLPSKVTDRPDPTKENNAAKVNQMPTSSTSETNQIQQTSSKTFISPKEFKGFPKVNEERSNRKPRKKGRSFIATSTPEIKLLEESRPIKSSEPVIKTAKRAVFQQEHVNHQESDSEILIAKENTSVDLEENIHKTLEKGNYVLVEFVKGVFYVGQILTVENNEQEVEIFFLRKSVKCNGFVTPQAIDICLINIHQIVLILPKPIPLGTTKRQQSALTFKIDLSKYNVR